MPSSTYPTQPPRSRLSVLLLTLLLTVFVHAQTQLTQATTVPLILPGGLAYDASGNLYFAETGNHVIRRVSPTGVLTTVAGTGTQGFAGDNGPAKSALLDSPTAIALDPAGDLFLADAHNHRIRRIDAGTGTVTTYAGTGAAGACPNATSAANCALDLPSALAFDPLGNLYFADSRTHLVRRIDRTTLAVTTVAGNGTQGFSGDNGPATLASIDSPSGLAIDASGNLFVADTHNQRLRRVGAATGIISSIAGTGQPGFTGDNSAAATAALRLPRGLTLDVSGNLFLVDSLNHRIRRIDAATGQITTLAGNGTQAFVGDNAPAVSASLDSPRAITLSPAALPTLSDTGNQRIRQIDSAANIHTIAGLGNTSSGILSLTGPSVTLYGTGALTATLVASAATGSVTFFDSGPGGVRTIATIPLTQNIATLTTTTLSAGLHNLTATYPGDTLHSAAQSSSLALTISPAPATASPSPVSLLYGQPIPTLTGSLTGILPQDSTLVSATFTSAASGSSAPASYPITATLTGASAANYALTQSAAAVTIQKAPSTVTLSNSLAVQVASTTSGIPTGTVTLFDASTPAATATLTNGAASFASAALSNGTHTLTTTYSGDPDFAPSSSAPVIANIGSSASADFTLATTGPTTISVPAGSPATFNFTVTPNNGALASPILLTVSGLPNGATASFSPATLPPSATPTAFTLTIQTPKTAALLLFRPYAFAFIVPAALLFRKRRRRLIGATALALGLTLGCGDRVTTEAVPSSVTYNVTILATATTASGTTLQHTASVVLTLD